LCLLLGLRFRLVCRRSVRRRRLRPLPLRRFPSTDRWRWTSRLVGIITEALAVTATSSHGTLVPQSAFVITKGAGGARVLTIRGPTAAPASPRSRHGHRSNRLGLHAGYEHHVPVRGWGGRCPDAAGVGDDRADGSSASDWSCRGAQAFGLAPRVSRESCRMMLKRTTQLPHVH
jgi:hypothetical protein